MAKQMLIDATHAEETRVVVLENGRLEEFDVDTSTKKQIKGNIYLAKVVRVEPSLQAAFIDYGGNRHGFLAFGEIHPDYYQIPVADREALKEQIAAEAAEEKTAKESLEAGEEPTESGDRDVETVSDAEVDDVIRHRSSFFRKYKIQEVVRQGQVMLVQVIKEERGNKGAALTTYLSLAGRYSVLMPNNGKGGGVSRKISNAKDRKSLRDIVDKLPIPEGMSVIIRTAGQGKTKTEIKRDYDYLIKTWMQIRENTLESIAPKLIHEEGDIIKRSLRDVFTPDIDEIWVEGESVFKSTKAFMKMLMPAQAKKIKQYKGEQPLFQEHQVESQLEAIHSNIVQLRSGGYLVIDQTEALVAVDVNSGRATREHDIEETALRTNLETCDELARQLRLRDLAGLVVIDFIDMDEQRNNAAVERRLKEALRKDRARIQVGKISGFGLMEMSRQRLHSSFLESSYHTCPHCGGKGVVRSTESCAMHALHLLEEAASKNRECTLIMSLPLDIVTYVLNFKRDSLKSMEDRYKTPIQILADMTLEKASDYRLERIRGNGERSTVQIMPTVSRRVDKNAERAQAIDAIVQQAAVAEEGGRHNKRRSRNQRRREWKRRQKQLAAEQAALNQHHLDNESVPVEESAPRENFTVVEQVSLNEAEGQVQEPRPEKKGKDRWKKRIKEKKTESGSTGETVSADSTEQKTVSEKPVRDKERSPKASKRQEKDGNTSVPAIREDHVPAVSETEQVESKPEVTGGEKKTPKKGGWWNRLMS